MEGFDLSTIDTKPAAEQGATLFLYNPKTFLDMSYTVTEGKKKIEKKVTITMAGMDSERYRRVQHELNNRRGKRIQKTGIMPTSEENEQENLLKVARCILAWEGIVVKGEVLPCNEANAIKLMTDFPFIYEQCSAFFSDRANFLKD